MVAEKNLQKQAYYYVSSSRPLEQLKTDSQVLVYNLRTQLWDIQGHVRNKVRGRSYQIQLSSGPVVIRNRKHLKKLNSSCTAPAFKEQFRRLDPESTNAFDCRADIPSSFQGSHDPDIQSHSMTDKKDPPDNSTEALNSGQDHIITTPQDTSALIKQQQAYTDESAAQTAKPGTRRSQRHIKPPSRYGYD